MFRKLWKIAKARGDQRPGHKYVMRIVIGTKPSGAPKYRYVYKVYTKGKYVHDEEFHKVGAHIPGAHEGQDGHWHVKETDDNTLTAEHNMSGKRVSMSRKEFSERLKQEHKDAVKAHKEKLAHDLIAVRKYGTAKMRKIVATEAAMYGVTFTGMYDPKTGKGESIDKEEVHRNVAVTLHEDVLPSVETSLSAGITQFPNPDKEMGMEELFPHQKEGAERILDSWKKRDGFLLQDDAGLGKTMTALAAMAENGGDRNLIIVPASGKKNLIRSWQESGKLYNLDIKHWKGSDMAEPGWHVASYDEIYKKEKFFDTELGKDSVRVTMRDEFKQDFDCVTFDESHNMANPNSTYTMAGIRLQDQAKKVLYMSATPFTTLSDTHYLRKMGWFKDGDEFTTWAEKAGAKAIRSNERNGALPYRMENPKSLVPLTVVSALLHFEGSGVKRQPIMRGLNSDFVTVPTKSLSGEHLHSFEVGEQCKEIAIDAGLTPYEVAGTMAIWRKNVWEAAKVDTAIRHAKAHLNDPAHDGKGQVAIFTEYTKHDHNALASLSRRLKERSRKGDLDKTAAANAVKQIDELVGSLPKHTVYDRLNEEFGGAGNVANIHGVSKTDSREEQRAYQTGNKRVLVASTAKAGVGMSFHDTNGDAPRLQINTSLPWAANMFQQVAGRSHRLGSKSDSRMMWLAGDDASEKNVASIVGTKLRSMGALVAGDPGKFIDHGLMQNYEYSSGHNPEVALQAHEEEFNDAPPNKDQEVQAARDNFREAVDRYRAHADPLAEQGQRLVGKRVAEQNRQQRIAVAKLVANGIQIHNHPGLRYRLEVSAGSRAHELASTIQRGATVDKDSNHIIVHDPRVLRRMVRELGFEKTQVDTPKDLTNNSLNELRYKYRGVLHKGKTMRFLDLYKSSKAPALPERFSDLVKAAGDTPVGTTHRWRDGRLMKKVAPGKWVPVPEASRQAALQETGIPKKRMAEVVSGDLPRGGQYVGVRGGKAIEDEKAGRTVAGKKVKGTKNTAIDEFGFEYQTKHDMGQFHEKLAGLGFDRQPQLFNDMAKHPEVKFRLNPKVKKEGHDIHSTKVGSWINPRTGKQMDLYTFEHNRRNSVRKFQAITSLFPQFDKSMGVFHDMFTDPNMGEKDRGGAACMYIIAKTGLRVGTEGALEKAIENFEAKKGKAKDATEPARGVCTLLKKHVTVKGSTVHFDFTGKSSVRNTAMINDKKLAQYITHRMSSLTPDDRLFPNTSTQCASVIKKAVKDGQLDPKSYGNFTPKDWRTVTGTIAAAEGLMKQGPVNLSKDPIEAARQLEDKINAASEYAATALNNDAATARKSYIHPGLIKAYIVHMGGEHIVDHFYKSIMRFVDLVKSMDTEHAIQHPTVKELIHGMKDWDGGAPGPIEPIPETAADEDVDGYMLPTYLH